MPFEAKPNGLGIPQWFGNINIRNDIRVYELESNLYLQNVEQTVKFKILENDKSKFKLVNVILTSIFISLEHEIKTHPDSKSWTICLGWYQSSEIGEVKDQR